MSPTPHRIAVIGFGMSGVGAVHALRHVARFVVDPGNFKPQVTVIEAAALPGGKAAPENLGAQFLDADAMYPFDRILADLKLRTHRVRQDYELVRLRLGNQPVIEAATFKGALAALRDSLSEALASMTFRALDALTVQRFIDVLRHRGTIDAGGQSAMRQRMLLEDGTVKVSALGYALSLAKTPTPVRRLEVVGGLYKVAARERESAQKDGVTFLMETQVQQVDVARDSTRVWCASGGEVTTLEFDRVILALSPEQLARIRISGKPLPLAPLIRMQPARITKSNLVVRKPVTPDEHATERYALWYSSGPGARQSETMATFFHGWEGQAPLSMWQMAKIVTGITSTKRIVQFATRTWDGTAQKGEIPMAYVTEPRPGECVPLLKLSRDLYFKGRHDSSPLLVASHALGIGANVREAALTGEWAVVSLLRSLGLDVSPALSRTVDPELELYGASRGILARELDEAGE